MSSGALAGARRREIGLGLGFFAGLFVIALIVRSRAVSGALNPDAGAYLYIGHLIVHGGVPYVDAIDNKGPLTYLSFALVGLVSGSSELTVRLILVGFTALTGLGVAGYVWRLAGRAAGLLAGVVFVVFSAGPWQGASVNTEQVGLAPMVGAWWLATRAGVGAAAGAGALVGTATLMNIGFAVIALPVAFELWRTPSRAARRTRFAAALGGCLVVSIPVVVWLLAVHAFGAMLHDFLGFGTGAVSGSIKVPHGLARRLSFEDVSLLAIAAAAALGAFIVPRFRPAAIGAVAWIAVMLGRAKLSPYDGRSFAHHYYPLLPGVAVGLALGGATVVYVLRRFAPLVGWMAVGAAGVALVTVYAEGPAAPSSPPVSIRPAAAFTRAHTRPGEHIIVSGYAPQVYWFADRDAADPLFSVPSFGVVSRTGNFLTTYRPRRLASLLRRPPRAVVVPPGAHDRDIAAALYLLPYRRAFRGCAPHRSVPRCTSVWLLPRSAPATRFSAARIAQVITALNRGGWQVSALAPAGARRRRLARLVVGRAPRAHAIPCRARPRGLLRRRPGCGVQPRRGGRDPAA